MWVALSWLTLYPVRRELGRLLRTVLAFETPEWVHKTSATVLVPRGRVHWFDWFNPIRWLVWVVGLAYDWVVSRHYFSLGPAVPSLVVILAMIYCVTITSFGKDSWRESFYSKLFQDSLSQKQNQLSRIAVNRLIERSPERADLLMQKALLEESMGFFDQAKSEMERLAVENRNGAAAFWLMQKTFPLSEVKSWDDNKHQAFKLLAMISGKRENESIFVASRVLLSQYLVEIGAIKEAIAQMESVVGDNCELQLVCAVLHFQSGSEDIAAQWAAKAQAGYKKIVLADPTNVEVRLKLAKTLLLQGEPDEIPVLLSEGYKITRDERLLTAGAESLVAWAIRLERSEKPSVANLIRRLRLLSKAAELAPKNSLVLETLMNTIIQCADNQDVEVARLRDLIVKNLDADRMHFVQGTIALLRGDLKQADGHLELAKASSANVPGVLNNLAVVMYQKDNPDLERALGLVNAALKSMPNQPQMRETRGQIYLRMKQYKEAIFDLEFALAAKEPPKPIHKSLAEAYEALGMQDVANSHLEMVSK